MRNLPTIIHNVLPLIVIPVITYITGKAIYQSRELIPYWKMFLATFIFAGVLMSFTMAFNCYCNLKGDSAHNKTNVHNSTHKPYAQNLEKRSFK